LFNRSTEKNTMTTPPDAPHVRPINKKRLRDRLHVTIYVLPNLLTTINMFFGFYAVVHAIMGDYVMAAYAIVGAAIFDLLDGRVARMTKSTSEFGAEYDSLCDLVSFGVAPGVLLFLWALQPFGRIGWLASFFFVACGALRLARFNVQKTVLNKAYFQGLPIPMAAGIVASSVLAFTELEMEASRSWVLLAITLLLGGVMVSTFPYRSFKDLDFKQRLPFKYLVFGVGLIAVIAMKPEVMLFVTFLTYALLGAIFGILRLGRKPKISTAGGSQVIDPNDLDDDSDDDLIVDARDDEDEDPSGRSNH
jgi:CDP-diacylglycerol---serine O-phosphatidyltransferase